MAQGSKAKYTTKQKRQAKHIEESAKKSGQGTKAAARIAWATVNKETGGAGHAVRNTASSKKGGSKGGKATRSTSTTSSRSRNNTSHAHA